MFPISKESKSSVPSILKPSLLYLIWDCEFVLCDSYVHEEWIVGSAYFLLTFAYHLLYLLTCQSRFACSKRNLPTLNLNWNVGLAQGRERSVHLSLGHRYQLCHCHRDNFSPRLFWASQYNITCLKEASQQQHMY